MDGNFGDVVSGHVQPRLQLLRTSYIEAARGEQNHAPNSAECKAEKVVATIRKRAREEVKTVPAIYMDALYILLKS